MVKAIAVYIVLLECPTCHTINTIVVNKDGKTGYCFKCGQGDIEVEMEL